MSFNPEATVKNRTPEDFGSITPGMSKPEIAKALMEDMVAIPDSKVIFEEELGERGPDDGVVMFRTRNPDLDGNYSATTAPEDETTRLLGRAKMGDAVIDLVQYVLPETNGKLVIGVVDKGKSCAEMLAVEEAAGRPLTVEEKKAIQARNTSFVEDGSMLTIGRGENSGLKLDDSNNRASRTHAKVVVHGDKVYVIDSSTNGTRWIGDADFMHVPNERNSGMTPTQAKELLSDTSPSLGSQEYSRAVVGHFEALSDQSQNAETPSTSGEDGQEGEGDGATGEPEGDVPALVESNELEQAERVEEAEALVATAEASEPDMSVVASEAWGIPVGNEAVKDADPVDEAVGAARRVLQEHQVDATDTELGAQSIEGEVSVGESEELAPEIEKNPQEILQEALTSPEDFYEASKNQDVPFEVRRKLQEIFDAWELVQSRREANVVWQEEMLPLLRTIKTDIKAEQIAGVSKEFASVSEAVSGHLRVINGAIDYLQDIKPGWVVSSAFDDIRGQTGLSLENTPQMLVETVKEVSVGEQNIADIAARVRSHEANFSELSSKIRRLERGDGEGAMSQERISQMFSELGGTISAADEAISALETVAKSEVDRGRQREIDEVRAGMSTLQRLASERSMELLSHAPDEVAEAVTCIRRHDYRGAIEWLDRSRQWMSRAKQTSSELASFASFLSRE